LVAPMAFALVDANARRSVLVTAALGVLFGARATIRAALRKRVHARLIAISVGKVLAGDPMRASVLARHDASRAIFDGATQGERLYGELFSDTCADAIAALVLTLYVAVTQPGVVVALGGVALAVVGAAVAVSRKIGSRSVERVWRAYIPVVDAV